MCERICLLPLISAPLRSAPHVIHALNQRDPGTALVHNLIALILFICIFVEKFLFYISYELTVTSRFSSMML